AQAVSIRLLPSRRADCRPAGVRGARARRSRWRDTMRGKRAGASTRIATVAAIAAALALGGCSDVDDALFGPPDQSAAVVRPIHADPGENPPPATEVASTE